MKHETTSLMTKTALANSLKKLMEKQPLSKISIREIIEDCNLNRKTFYYHFQDIYDLVRWMFEVEAIEIVKQYDLIIDYEDAIHFIMDYIDDNKHICNSVIDAVGRDELKRFFQRDFNSIIRKSIEQLSEGMSIPQDYIEFLSDFYTESLAAILINWIRNRENADREKTIQYIKLTLFGGAKSTLENAEMELNNSKI